jgi:acyl-CoA thioester hydrolase
MPLALPVNGNCDSVPGRLAHSSSPYWDMNHQHTITLRVRYPEADAMGYLHHSRFFQYFEMGRIELLRAAGHRYADLEREGIFFVVVKAECRFKAPAKFDDELTLLTRINRQTLVRIDHGYELRRGHLLLAEGETTIACVDRDGKLVQIPGILSQNEASGLPCQ